MAWLTGYSGKRRKLTTDSSLIPGDLTDFVAFYDFSAYSTGGEIRVTKSDGTTELPREVNSGLIWFKVSGALSSSSDTDFYVYYDDGGKSDYAVTATYGRNNVWTDYAAVYHLEEDAAGTGTTGLYVDSTGNGNDGDDRVSDTGKNGKVGSGQNFDGVDDDIACGDPWTAFGTLSEGSFLAWIRPDVTTSNQTIYGARNSGGGSTFHYLRLRTSGGNINIHNNTVFGASQRNIRGGTNIPANTWTHVGFTVGTTAAFYVDGSAETITVLGGTNNDLWWNDASASLDAISIGDQPASSGNHFDGEIDEVWHAEIELSANYVQTVFNNQDAPATFFTIGAEETETSFKPILAWF